MPGPACCLLAAFLSSAGVVEAAAGVDGEVAAGRAPVDPTNPDDNAENSLTFTLVPGAALRLRSATNNLSLTYTPRIFYRAPNVLEVDRPLVLHQVSLDDAIELSRRLSWSTTAQLSIGEIDYTASGLVFDPGTSAVRTSVADIVRVDGQTGIKYEVNRRLRLTLDASAEYTTPIGDSDNITGLPDGAPLPENVALGAIPESAQVSAESALSYALSRTDRVGVAGEVTYQWFPDTGRFLLFSPDVTWESQVNRRTNFAVSAGIAYVVALETQGGVAEENAFGGTGSFELASVFHKGRQMTVAGAFNASLDWFFDPVAGTSQPRAGVDAGVDVQIGRKWQISPNASFYAVLRDRGQTLGEPPITTPDGTMAPVIINQQGIDYDATQLRGEIPFRYSLSKHVILSFGARGSLRGNSITDDDFQLDRLVEIWAFGGLTVRFSSGRDYGNWLAL
jgi:hypothetical protein